MENSWNLNKIIKNNKEFERLISECESLINKLVSYKGKITKNSKTLYEFLKLEETLNRKYEKLYVYSYLNYYSDMTSDKFKNLTLKVNNLGEKISDNLSFVLPEMMECDYKTIKNYIKENDLLSEYAFSLEQIYRYKSHTLSKAEEKIIANATNAMGLCDEAYAALNNADVKFEPIKDEKGKVVELNQSNYSVYIKSKSSKVRKSAFISMHNFYKEHINTISNLYLGDIKEHYFVSNVKKFNSPLEKSLFSDKIKPELYDLLIKVVNENLPLLHRYIALKKKMLKSKDFHIYDVYVEPLKVKNKKVGYDKCLEMIYDALAPLGKTYITDLKKGIASGWVDVYPKKGKRSGAYSWGSYDTLPYLSINYENDYSSVDTLIHELGHSMHSYYSNKGNNYSDASYPIFLAEIASTVNEMLLTKYMLNNTKDKNEVKKYVFELLESIRTTIFRQIMFAEFERDIYDKYNNGVSITSEELNSTYYNLNKKYFGENIIINEEIKYEWARIPHFYTPFYVYKYATGLIVSLIISDKLIKEEGFKEKYIKFLSSGGSDYPLNILKKLGIDITKKETLESAFKIFEEYLNILEKE